ncbi:hypothetical protein [Neisseria sp. CCUG12390]|uniref:hypothetical protein n=1 Tax=Neisseria sp. CCUG12390 TaxID=3392035 RepID=UPI003A100AC2
MFWYIIGFLAAVAGILTLWVNAGAFGMEEDDGAVPSEYERMLGLGATLKDKDTVGRDRDAAKFQPDD